MPAPQGIPSAASPARADLRLVTAAERYRIIHGVCTPLRGRDVAGVRTASHDAARRRQAELLAALPLGSLQGKACARVGGEGLPGAVCASLTLTPTAGTTEARLTDEAGMAVADGSLDVLHLANWADDPATLAQLLQEAARVLRTGGYLIVTAHRLFDATACALPARAVGTRAPRPTSRPSGSRLRAVMRSSPRLLRMARFVRHRLTGTPLPPADAPVPADAPAPRQPESIGSFLPALVRDLLGTRFDILQTQGFGGAAGDDAALAEATPAQWAADLADEPERAAGLVLLARNRGDGAGNRLVAFPYDAPAITYRGGPWDLVGLDEATTCRMTLGGEDAWFTLPFEGNALLLEFGVGSHAGEAVVDVDGVTCTVNLYHPTPQRRHVYLGDLGPGRHLLRISGGRERDPRSQGDGMLFLGAHVCQPESTVRPVPGRRPRTPAEIEALRQKVASRPWFHIIDLGDGVRTPGCDNSAAKVGYLGLPDRLDGRSVLDIGAYDGYFSFECERRGAARVVASDHFCWTYGCGMATKEGFDTARAALGSRVEEALVPVEELAPARVGTFDLVLFLGVLYHAPDPIRYLRAVRSICRDWLILETEVDAEDYPRPAAVFYPGGVLNNDPSNFWGPNSAAVEAMLREVGFRKVERVCTFNLLRRDQRSHHRAVFHAFL